MKRRELRPLNISNKKAQIWVETVTYTLIGLTIIGLLIAGIKPKIEEAKDKSLIHQIKSSLEDINQEISKLKIAPGNQRTIFVNLEKGTLIIDSEKDTISWKIDSSYKYSEPNLTITEGNLEILTTVGSPWKITATLPLELNLTYENSEETKEFRETSTAYEFAIKNNGETIDIKNIN